MSDLDEIDDASLIDGEPNDDGLHIRGPARISPLPGIRIATDGAPNERFEPQARPSCATGAAFTLGRPCASTAG